MNIDKKHFLKIKAVGKNITAVGVCMPVIGSEELFKTCILADVDPSTEESLVLVVEIMDKFMNKTIEDGKFLVLSTHTEHIIDTNRISEIHTYQISAEELEEKIKLANNTKS